MATRTLLPPPGRLGVPELTLGDDPRTDQQMLAALAPFGLHGATAPAPIGPHAPAHERHQYFTDMESILEGLFASLMQTAPNVDGIERSEVTISGVDGNDITLFIHRREGLAGPAPAIVHFHGGGMAILSAAGPVYAGWRDRLAASGLIVIGVEFRNATGARGPHPFPAGLNDCSSALEWTHQNRAALGASKIVLSGESGGANLSIATTLKAKQDGELGSIDGVYAQAPYISNDYTDQRTGLVSYTENDTYFINLQTLGVLASVYDGADSTNPLAWPGHASDADLAGLPPHFVSVNQLDPLRDEGLRFAGRLVVAGNSVVSRTVNGTVHAGDVWFQNTLSDTSAATVRSISGFAHGLSTSRR